MDEWGTEKQLVQVEAVKEEVIQQIANTRKVNQKTRVIPQFTRVFWFTLCVFAIY